MFNIFGGIQFLNQPILTRGRRDARLSLDMTGRKKNQINKHDCQIDILVDNMKVQLQFISFFQFYREEPNFRSCGSLLHVDKAKRLPV